MVNVSDYGRALFELAQEEGQDTAILEETRAVAQILKDNPEYVKLLDSPAVPAVQRVKLVDEAFSEVTVYHLNFLKILCEKHCVSQYAACMKAYEVLYDEAYGIIRASAVTAVPMSNLQLRALTDKLCTITKKKVLVTNQVDKAIMGGVQLRIGGTQLDGSIQSRLDDLRRLLSGAIV